MNKKKIIGLLVAFGGAVGSFAGAAALYTKSAEDVRFGIGASYQAADGSIAYKIDGKQSGTITPTYLKANGDNGGSGYSPTYTQAQFLFPVSADYTLNPQPYIVGNFAVSLTNVDSRLHNKAKVWVDYYINNPQNHQYDGKWMFSDANKPMAADQAITGSTFDFNNDIAVSSSGEFSVRVLVKLDSAVSEADMLALAETVPFNISVTWGAPSAAYDPAYIVGDKIQWSVDDAYRMVPNLKASSYQWYFAGLHDFEGNAKCKMVADPDVKYSGGDDYNVLAGHTYDVTWDGYAATDCPAANFSDVTPQP